MSSHNTSAQPDPYATPSPQAAVGNGPAYTPVAPDGGAFSYQPTPPAPGSYPSGYASGGAYGPFGVNGGPGDYSKLNTYSILAIVFAFVFAPLGIVFGALARAASKVPGAPEWMKTVGNVGFWVSLALTALPFLLGLLILLGTLTFGARGFSGGTVCVTDPNGVTTCERQTGWSTRRASDPIVFAPTITNY